jgi:hypothetical protein
MKLFTNSSGKAVPNTEAWKTQVPLVNTACCICKGLPSGPERANRAVPDSGWGVALTALGMATQDAVASPILACAEERNSANAGPTSAGSPMSICAKAQVRPPAWQACRAMLPLPPASVTVRSCDVGLQGNKRARPLRPVRTSRQSSVGAQAPCNSPSIAAQTIDLDQAQGRSRRSHKRVDMWMIISSAARQCHA